MRNYIPDFYAKNIYIIPNDFYKNHHFSILFVDLDNTLDSYLCKTPSKKALDLVNELKSIGIKIFIISNNHYERVKKYASVLEVEYLYKSGKPFGKKINQFIDDKKLNRDNILLIGDQLITDIRTSKRIKVKSLLTDKLVKEDQWTTRFNRIADTIIRNRLRKKNILSSKEVK